MPASTEVEASTDPADVRKQSLVGVSLCVVSLILVIGRDNDLVLAINSSNFEARIALRLRFYRRRLRLYHLCGLMELTAGFNG